MYELCMCSIQFATAVKQKCEKEHNSRHTIHPILSSTDYDRLELKKNNQDLPDF